MVTRKYPHLYLAPDQDGSSLPKKEFFILIHIISVLRSIEQREDGRAWEMDGMLPPPHARTEGDEKAQTTRGRATHPPPRMNSKLRPPPRRVRRSAAMSRHNLEATNERTRAHAPVPEFAIHSRAPLPPPRGPAPEGRPEKQKSPWPRR